MIRDSDRARRAQVKYAIASRWGKTGEARHWQAELLRERAATLTALAAQLTAQAEELENTTT